MRPLRAVGSACQYLSLISYDRPRTAIALVVFFLAASFSQIPRLQVNTSVATLLGVDSPAFQSYESFVNHFGHDVYAIITVSGDDVLNTDNLRRLQALHEAVSDVSPLIERVTSLLNAPLPRERDGRVVFAGALNPWPESPDAWQERKTAILAHAPYMNVLLNEARNMTIIAIHLKNTVEQGGRTTTVSTPEYARLVDRLKPIIETHEAPGFSLELTGEAAADAAIQRAFLRELAVLGGCSFVLGTLLIIWIFGQWRAAMVPVAVIISTIIGCFASMAAVGQPLLLTSTILPPLIVGLSVADAAHVLNAWSRNVDAVSEPRKAFQATLEETALPVAMTTLTTATGLFSFMLVDVQALWSFGLFAGLATLMAGIFTLVFTGIVLSRMPGLRTGSTGLLGRQRHRISALAVRCASISSRRPKSIILTALLLAVGSTLVLSKLELNHDTLDWVPADWTEVRGMALLDERFGAASAFEVVIDSGREGGALDPAFIVSLREFVSLLEQGRARDTFSAVTSIDSYLKEISRALNGTAIRYQDFSNARSLVWRDVRLFRIGMPETFAARMSEDYRFVRVTLNTTRHWAMQFDQPATLIKSAAGMVEGFNNVTITGFLPVLRHTLDIIVNGAIISFFLSMLVIGCLMGVFFRSLRLAAVSLLPNVTPILVVLAMLSLMGRALDMITIMIGSLVIGVIVDDTIHFVANYRRGRATGLLRDQASQYALEKSGHAMVVTTLVLVAAFSILAISELENLGLFASISGGILLLGLVSDFLLMPAIMHMIDTDQET